MNWEEWSPEDEEADAGERESARLRREVTKYEKRLETVAWKIVSMNPEELHDFNFDDELLDAIAIARPLKPSRALNRQVRLIVKFFRQWDEEQANKILEEIEEGAKSKAALLQYTELWRKSLIEHGDTALGALLSAFPDIDRQHIRQLCRTIQKAKTETKKQRAYKELFQTLKKADLNQGPPRF